LRDRTSAAGVVLLVAIFPESFQVGVDDPDLSPQRRLLALCDELRLDCLDLQPAFERAGGQLFADVSHPNAAGHAVAAAAIASRLSLGGGAADHEAGLDHGRSESDP
jgi:hypothetical protein